MMKEERPAHVLSLSEMFDGLETVDAALRKAFHAISICCDPEYRPAVDPQMVSQAYRQAKLSKR